jgi:hypothetical protein
MELALQYAKYTAKAGLSALAVVVAFLAATLTGDQTLADVTFVQWLVCSGLVLASWGFVYAAPNGAKPGA